MNFYWNLNQQAYFMKQIAMNNYLQIEPHRFRKSTLIGITFYLTLIIYKYFSSFLCPFSNEPVHRTQAVLSQRIPEADNQQRCEQKVPNQEENQHGADPGELRVRQGRGTTVGPGRAAVASDNRRSGGHGLREDR